jgi:hypothetical protein
MNDKNALTIYRTPNPDCPACALKTVHTPDDWKEFHPFTGHGYTRGVGWSHPDIERALSTPPTGSPQSGEPIVTKEKGRPA